MGKTLARVQQVVDLVAVFFYRGDPDAGNAQEFGCGDGARGGDGPEGLVGQDAKGRDSLAFGLGQTPGA